MVLPADKAERLGGVPKALMRIDGVPLIRRLLAALHDAGVARTAVVTEHRADDVGRALALTYGAIPEEARRFGLPCGGPLQIVLELLTAHSGLSALLEAAEGPTHRRTQLGHGDPVSSRCGR